MSEIKQGKLIIHAPNVHSGGGKVLLNSLLDSLPSSLNVYLQVDSRMALDPSVSHIKVQKIKPRFIDRFIAEKKLLKLANSDDTILCFGNLPPLFKLNANVILYLQNRYLLESKRDYGFSFIVRLRILVERFWLATFLINCNQVLVQTATMANLFASRFPNMRTARVLPFIPDHTSSLIPINPGEKSNAIKNDFLYVANGEPHKNHLNLLQAWKLLADAGIYPSLRLTIDRHSYPKLVQIIFEEAKINRLNIENIGNIEHNNIFSIYQNSKALIYPSFMESFGLPLVEAAYMGLDILASESDYIRDVVDPIQTFDPGSPISIARSVQRYLFDSKAEPRILGASDFISTLISPK